MQERYEQDSQDIRTVSVCEQLGGRQIGNACVVADPASSNSYYYLPLRCDVQRGDDGKPMFSLIEFGGGAFVNATTIWDLPADELERVRATLTSEQPDDDRQPVKLAFLSSRVLDAKLTITDEGDCPITIATSTSSGHPPYSALFSANLDAEQTKAFKDAMQGSRGTAGVAYTIELYGQERRVRAAASGDMSDIFAQIRDAADRDALLADDEWLLGLVERGLEEGQIRIEITLPDEIADTEARRLQEAMIRFLIDWIRERAQDEDFYEQTELCVETELGYRPKLSWGPQTDIANWFATPGNQSTSPANYSKNGTSQ